MRILANAVNLSSAGGMSVAKNFFENIKNHQNHTFVLIVPESCGYEKFEEYENVTIHAIGKTWTKYLGRLIFDYFLIKKILVKEKPDVIFTMGNFAIPTKKYKQLLFFAWPYAVYPEAIKQLNFSTKQRLIQYLRLFSFKTRLKYATVISPQTYVDKERLKNYYSKICKIKVVSNAYTAVEDKQFDKQFDHLKSEKTNLLCLSRYYVHKNIEILLQVAEQFKERKLPFRIILTLDPADHKNVATILRYISEKKLTKYIFNIGSLPLESIIPLYKKCDALLLPTLLEAFSTTYADSMNLRKTILTSDKGFAHGVCGNAAFYFDPLSAEDITKTILEAYARPSLKEEKLRIGKKQIESFPDWREVAQRYISILEEIGKKVK